MAKTYVENASDPAFDAVAATVSDTVADPAGPFRGFLVTAAGTVKFTTQGGTAVTLSAVTVGQIYPIRISHVWSTGTSATIYGLT